MNYLSKAINVLKRDGILRLLKKGTPFVYNRHVAPLLPRNYVVYNGVGVGAERYFDSIVPWRHEKEDKPDYESGIISGIEEYVNRGDNIVIVGGGWGVTAVKAARKAGRSGKVTIYEGSIDGITNIQDTIRQNYVSDRVDIIHGIVGPKISLRGKEGKAAHVSPDELPECDVLELDCEGSEIEILRNLTVRPRVILVESHGMYGAPSSMVKDLLEEMSYSVESKEVADKENEENCIENDVYTLVAVPE